MPPRIVLRRRSGTVTGVFLSALVWSASPLQGQDLLPLQRDYPGARPYECPVAVTPADPTPEQVAQAAQLAAEANQALLLGDLERAEVLLQRAVDLNPLSADIVYRHARTLEDLERPEPAMREYCRALTLDPRAIGIFDAQDRLDELDTALRSRLPVAARQAFQRGVEQVDDSLYVEAVESFSAALDVLPEWLPPIYNRAVTLERMGRIQEALADFRLYLQLDPSAQDAIAVLISERIGQLEGVASVRPPSPTGALALGLIPGMGHYYTGRPLGGTLTLVAASAAVAAGFSFRNITVYCDDEVPPGGACPNNLIVDEVTTRPYFWYGVGLGAAITIVGALEARSKAKERWQEAESITRSGESSGLTLAAPSITSDGLRLDFNVVSLRFH